MPDVIRNLNDRLHALHLLLHSSNTTGTKTRRKGAGLESSIQQFGSLQKKMLQ